jgi:hypothetical protein
MSSYTAVIIILGLCTVAALQSGCRDREVQAYRVPKEPAVPPELASSLASTPAPTTGAISWNAPEAWVEKPTTAMRRGSFTIVGNDGAEADFSVIAFPGDAGGMLENVNRWRGQVSLGPLAAPELEASLRHMDIGPLHIDVVDFAGQAAGVATRITGAIFSHAGESWFIKLTGPDALVAAAKPDFISFVESLEVAR